jgi:hypothetical protein
MTRVKILQLKYLSEVPTKNVRPDMLLDMGKKKTPQISKIVKIHKYIFYQ